MYTGDIPVVWYIPGILVVYTVSSWGTPGTEACKCTRRVQTKPVPVPEHGPSCTCLFVFKIQIHNQKTAQLNSTCGGFEMGRLPWPAPPPVYTSPPPKGGWDIPGIYRGYTIPGISQTTYRPNHTTDCFQSFKPACFVELGDQPSG